MTSVDGSAGAAGTLRDALAPRAVEPDGRRAPKTSEVVARRLAAHIVDAGLPPGTALPHEKEMTQLLGVGRTTLREALRLLETRGVITIRSGPGGGPVVRRLQPEDLRESVSLMLQFADASLEDVIGARMWLESALARDAAPRITDDELARLRAVNARLGAEGLDDESAFAADNEEFRRIIAGASGSIVLAIFLAALHAIADGRGAGVVYDRAFREQVAHDHERLIEALETRDPDAADAAAREHVQAAARHWRRDHADLVGRRVSWDL